jgi:hypothetical protein
MQIIWQPYYDIMENSIVLFQWITQIWNTNECCCNMDLNGI